jgi:hypothetical protein
MRTRRVDTLIELAPIAPLTDINTRPGTFLMNESAAMEENDLLECIPRQLFPDT